MDIATRRHATKGNDFVFSLTGASGVRMSGGWGVNLYSPPNHWKEPSLRLRVAFISLGTNINIPEGSCTWSGQLNSIRESTPFPVSSQPHACGSFSCSSQVRLQHHACLSVAILPAIMIRASPSGTVSPKNSFS